MQYPSAGPASVTDAPPPRDAPLPVDRRTLACVALGGALAALGAATLSGSPTWRALEFDVRLAGLAVLSAVTGVLFGLRDRIGDRLFAFLVFGVLAGFASVGTYALVVMIAMPPSAGVRFLVAAPIVAAVGTFAGAALVRRGRR